MKFIGGDPAVETFDSFGIGGNNHIAGFFGSRITIDGYREGLRASASRNNIIRVRSINGVHKLIVPCPWGGKVVVSDVKFGTMKGEDAHIQFGADPNAWLYGVPPYTNSVRSSSPWGEEPANPVRVRRGRHQPVQGVLPEEDVV